MLAVVAAGGSGSVLAQEPPNPRVFVGEAPIVAGNAASAKQRAMDDVFRQAVERTFAVLVAEAGASASAPPAGLAQLRSTFFSRAKRYIRSYRLLEQTETATHLRITVDAEVDEGLLRREIDRARGAPNTVPSAARPTGSASLVLVVGTPPEATLALGRALGGAGIKADTPPLGAIDEAKAREIALRGQHAAALVVSGNVTDEGPVRGTAKSSASCRLAVRLLAVGQAPPGDRGAEARAFSDGADAARAECLARAAGDVARQIAGSLAGAAPPARDMRVVTLDLDLIEPAALPLFLQACKKVGSVSSAEVRRVTVGHVELRAITRLAAPALVTAIARELTGVAELTPGQTVADRASVQVRMAAPVTPVTPPANP